MLRFRAQRPAGPPPDRGLLSRSVRRRSGSCFGARVAGIRLLPVQIAVVVAGEHRGPAAVDLDYLVGDLPYQRPVVGYETNGAVIVAQGIGEYFSGSDVEVVGRFVHQEQVTRLEEQLGQGHPRLFPAGQH